jgi:hypothetical protein
MVYLLDENVLISAKNLYYKFEQVPEYWGWLSGMADKGSIKIPIECYNGMENGKTDELAKWLKKNIDLLVYNTKLSDAVFKKVKDEGYGLDLNETELAAMNSDCHLIAHALNGNYTVVTSENSNPKKERGNAKIPDVCAKLKVKCISPFELNDELKFSTSWNRTKI